MKTEIYARTIQSAGVRSGNYHLLPGRTPLPGRVRPRGRQARHRERRSSNVRRRRSRRQPAGQFAAHGTRERREDPQGRRPRRVASAGHVADARQLVDLARRRAQGEQLRYGQRIGVETLTRAVTDHIQEYTQTGGARPFGVALLVGGIDDGEPKLFETDPSGTDYEWKAAAIGGDRDTIQGYLEEHYREDLDVDGGIELALSALSAAEDDLVDAVDVDVATVTTDDESFRSVETDRLESILAEVDTPEETDE